MGSSKAVRACGRREEPPGSFEICDICNWEDDRLQLQNPFLAGGANRESLFEYQKLCLTRLPLDVVELDDRKRDPSWRPLQMADASLPAVRFISSIDFNQKPGESPLYYWR
jgi:hypothetical protein